MTRFARACRSALLSGIVLGAVATMPRAAHAQQDARLRAQRDTLDRIRREREDLERRAADLQSTVHDLNEEVSNLNRRREATARIVTTLNGQLETITSDVNDASTKLASAEQELAVKRKVLHKRLVDIYKRGPLFTTEAMLSARSFGELVARYKYLHLLTLHDRALVTRVTQLRDEVRTEHDRLVTLQTALEDSKTDKLHEEDRLRSLESEGRGNLAKATQQAKITEDRLVKLRATETSLGNAIASFEAERKRAETTRSSSAPRASSSIKTSDYGKLDWPVDGPLLYTFGKAQTANNTTIRWNGVGIRATVGTNVRSVSSGRVVSVGQLGTYGLTVIIDHGGGDYSIYGSLARADVRQQQMVTKGQVIGGVGISDPDYPSHLHFEIRHAGADGRPASVDPADWLRDQK